MIDIIRKLQFRTHVRIRIVERTGMKNNSVSSKRRALVIKRMPPQRSTPDTKQYYNVHKTKHFFLDGDGGNVRYAMCISTVDTKSKMTLMYCLFSCDT
jgi:hypothetical protein